MNSTKKFIAGSLLALSAFSFAGSASAQSVSDLQAQINALLAQIAALQGGNAPASCYTYTRSLTVGARGEDVRQLQIYLNARGYTIAASGAGSPGNETTYFGARTRAATARYQAAFGISPAAGYFGPVTRAHVNARCTPTPTPPTPTPPTPNQPPLSGTDGTIEEVSALGQYSNEEVAEDQTDVRVLGADIEASNDGDIRLTSIRVSFDPAGNTGSDNLDDYIENVDVWLGNTKIGSADVDDFTEDSDDQFVNTISLQNAIIRANQTGKLYITVDAAGNIDSGDISGDSWTVDIENIRYVDGSGVTTTDSSTGDINDMNVPINFVSFAQAADTTLRIATASNSPDEGIVVIDGDDGDDDVVLLRGTLRVEGDSDVTIDELPVTLTATGVSDLDSVVNNVTLTLGNETFTESVNTSASSATITFDDLDFEIKGDQTVNFTVAVDVNEFGGDFGGGDTIRAQITATNRDNIDAENDNGDQLPDSDKSGTALGDAQEIRETGLNVRLVSAETFNTPGPSSNDDMATFRIRFGVRAVGDTVYVSSAAGSTGVNFQVDRAGTVVSSGTNGVLTNVTDSDLTSNGNYLVEEGTEEIFELSVTAQLPTAGTAGQYRLTITGIKWDTDDDATPDETYTSNLDNLRTSYIGVN